MRLSSLADYAVLLMRSAAAHCGGERASAASLAAETGIPVPTAQKLVSQLGRAGLIKATRGSGGGIKLARPAAAITLADIIEAVEGPIALTACTEAGAHDCVLEGRCAPETHWSGVNALVRGALEQVTLASFIAKPARAPLSATEPPALAAEGALS